MQLLIFNGQMVKIKIIYSKISLINYFFLIPEIHMAAKETLSLAEKRFMSNSHEWQFDNAWQEMLNHATLKVRSIDNKT